jgi:hypothetical protein
MFLFLSAVICFTACVKNADQKAPVESEAAQISTPDDTDIKETPAAVSNDEYQIVYEHSDMDFSKSGLYEIEANVIYNIDLNEDGILENISVSHTTREVAPDTYLTVNDVEYEKLGIEWFKQAYIIRKESGNVGILVYGDVMADNNMIILYAFDGILPVIRAEHGADLITIDTDSLSTRDIFHMLGTWFETQNYVINDDFTIESDEFSNIESNANNTLKTKMDITVQLLNNEIYSDAVLPSGSVIIPTQTGLIDNKTCLVFKTEDGSTGRFFVEFKDQNYYINGINEYDLFENIHYVYAGA